MKYRVLTGGLFILGLCVVSAPTSSYAGGITDIGEPIGKILRCTDPRELVGSCLRPKKKKAKPPYNPSAYSLKVKAYEQRYARLPVKLKKPARAIQDKRVK